MKRALASLLLLILTGSTASYAQFRTEGSETQPKLNTVDAMKDGGSLFSRIFDPSRFSMHQTYSMSMSTSSYGSYGLSMFTNTFSYKASDNLFIAADVSAVYTPFNSFGDRFSKEVNGIYLSSARLDWKLGESTFLRVAYSGGPAGTYGGYNPSFMEEFGNPAGSSVSTPGGFPSGLPGSKTVFTQVTH